MRAGIDPERTIAASTHSPTTGEEMSASASASCTSAASSSSSSSCIDCRERRERGGSIVGESEDGRAGAISTIFLTHIILGVGGGGHGGVGVGVDVGEGHDGPLDRNKRENSVAVQVC